MIVGIDPGLTGALAVLTSDGTLHALWDTPTLTLRVTRASLSNSPGSWTGAQHG